MRYNKLIIFNFIAFQMLWWLCVFSASLAFGWMVIFLVMLVVWMHLQWVERVEQALPLLLSATVGCIFDQLLFKLGYVHFDPAFSNGVFIPIWMIALWLAFATTLNSSLRWLQGKLRLSAILGAVFGPLAYIGAQALHAVQLPLAQQSLIVISMEWATVLPLLLWIRQSFNQHFHLTDRSV